jgi:hypothetical protein
VERRVARPSVPIGVPGLVERAGKPVEDEPAQRLFSGQSGLDEFDHEPVGDEFPPVHIALGFDPERSAVGDVLAEQVPRGQMRHSVDLRQPLTLRPFAGTRWGEKERTQHGCPLRQVRHWNVQRTDRLSCSVDSRPWRSSCSWTNSISDPTGGGAGTQTAERQPFDGFFSATTILISEGRRTSPPLVSASPET